MDNKGLIYVFEGDGKGKTSAALGVTVRMLLMNKSVVWVSWYKTLNWQLSEARLTEYFGSNLKMFFTGEGFFIKGGEKTRKGDKTIKRAKVKKATVYDDASPESHKIAAQKALTLVNQILSGKNPPDLMVMDEVIKAVNDDLLLEEDVLKVMDLRCCTHLVLTGHVASKLIVSKADLVTDMKKIKHPYDKGVLAIKGLDY